MVIKSSFGVLVAATLLAPAVPTQASAAPSAESQMTAQIARGHAEIKEMTKRRSELGEDDRSELRKLLSEAHYRLKRAQRHLVREPDESQQELEEAMEALAEARELLPEVAVVGTAPVPAGGER